MKKMIYLLAVVLFIAACGPSVESESKSWTQNLEKVAKLKTQYPAYSALIDSKITQAQTLWDAAAGITDEDAKAAKMAEANSMFEAGPVGQLSGMTGKIQNLKSLQTQLSGLDVKTTEQARAAEAKRLASEAIATGEAALMTSGSLTENDAIAKLSGANSKLESVISEMTGLIKVVTDKAKAVTDSTTTTTTNSTNNTTNTNNTTTTPTETKLKCDYCGSMNKSTDTKCSSCGANVEK